MIHEFLRLSTEGIWRFDVTRPIETSLAVEAQIQMMFESAVLTECNPMMARMYGVEQPEEVIGKPLSEFLRPDAPANRAHLRAFIESGYELRGAESIDVDPHGAAKYFSNNVFGVVEDGKFVRAWGTQQDLTHQRSLAKERADSDRLFRRLVDLVPQMLWICLPDGSAEYWSEAGLAYLGKTTADISGWNWREVIHPEDLPLAVEKWNRSRETGQRYEVEYRLRRFDGQYLWHLGLANCERDEQGGIVRWYGTCANVHDHRVAQVALSRARDHAEEANRAKDQFLAVLSHELRTPLNPVLIAATELSANKELPEHVREDARTIRQNVELEARIIDDLLDLTRITHGKLRMSFQPLDMHAALYDVLKICGGEAQRKGVALILDLEANSSWIEGDDARVRQVLWNLLNNAVKFTPEGGRVLVRTLDEGASEEHRVTVEVRDSGIGIERGALDRIFRAFEQETAHGRRFGGLGLGLAISRFIADAHGGTLSAQSEGRGLGSTFRFTLPNLDQAGKPGSRFPQKVTPVPLTKPCHILLVEDHDDTRRLLARALTRYGHSVRVAANVAEALIIGGSESLDLVISDIGLPDGTGYEVMMEILKRQRVPGIALTGYGMDEDVRRAADAGFNAHLTKPVEFEKLQGAMSVVLGMQS